MPATTDSPDVAAFGDDDIFIDQTKLGLDNESNAAA